MPTRHTTQQDPEHPGLTRDDIAAPAREPLEDHSGAGWGAWGCDQPAQDDEEKSLVDVLSVAGEEQRVAHRGAAEGAPARDIPSPLLNPTARDIRMETHETEEARMASEPPGRGS